MATATVEDYIKHIYLMAEKTTKPEVSMGQVADALGVVPGTATTMVKTLADAGLVRMRRASAWRSRDRERSWRSTSCAGIA